jgi:non-heme chloroperoxidase
MTRQGHALIAAIVFGFCCLGAIAIDESLSGEQQSTAETGPRDESPHTVHFVTVESNIKLEVLDWGGSGRAIVLLAGLGNTAHVFDDFAPKLTGTYHVYGVTRRGFGNSSSPRGTRENYSADRLGDDVLAVIRSLGLKRPVLVGHSIAGEELSDIGTRHPEMVAALVYLDAAYSYAFYDPSRGDLTLDSIELRDKLDELIPGRETTDRKHVYEDLLVMLPRFENELRIHQQEIRNVPEPLESGTPKVEEAIDSGERRFAGTTVPTLAIFAIPHDFGSAFKSNPIAQAAAEEADQSWTGGQIRFIESKYPSIRLVSIPHASHFVFQSNEADVLHAMNLFIHGLNVEKASAKPVSGRAVR